MIEIKHATIGLNSQIFTVNVADYFLKILLVMVSSDCQTERTRCKEIRWILYRWQLALFYPTLASLVRDVLKY